jgi:hypothetical protein
MTVRPEPRVRWLARAQAGLVSRHQCRELGICDHRLASLVRAGHWTRPTRGVYDTGQGDPALHPLDLARMRAGWLACLAAPSDAVVVGLSALALHGIHGLPRQIPPEVTLPGGRGAPGTSAVTVRRFERPLEVVRMGPRIAPGHEGPEARKPRVASVRCALVQALPELPRDTAVAMLDSGLHLGRLGAEDLDWIAEQLRGRRGAAGVHGWLALVDGRAESPMESFARLDCVDHGLPPDDLQVEVRDARGLFVARVDLGWRRKDGRWVLVEVDGSDVHSNPAALFADRERQNAIATRSDALLLRFAGRDVLRGGIIPDEVRRALAA